jgi:hypothetical protein
MADFYTKWVDRKVAIQANWLRITQNPSTTLYPRTGSVVLLKNHKMLADGAYLVTAVIEYEPPFTKDKEGRDVRITLLSADYHPYVDMNGVKVLEAAIRIEPPNLELIHYDKEL